MIVASEIFLKLFLSIFLILSSWVLLLFFWCLEVGLMFIRTLWSKYIYFLLQTLVIYVENMLKLESGVFGELVRSTMLAGLVDLLLDLDVRLLFFCFMIFKNFLLRGSNIIVSDLVMCWTPTLSGGDWVGWYLTRWIGQGNF